MPLISSAKDMTFLLNCAPQPNFIEASSIFEVHA
jgi:hypothetical protein